MGNEQAYSRMGQDPFDVLQLGISCEHLRDWLPASPCVTETLQHNANM